MARKRVFTMCRGSTNERLGERMPLLTSDAIGRFCQIYSLCRAGEPVPKELLQAKTDLESSFRENLVMKAGQLLLVEANVGVTAVSPLPWLAIMDARETGTVQRGVTVLILFRQDMSGFYIRLGCGVTDFENSLDGNRLFGTDLTRLQICAENLQARGFKLGNEMDLRTKEQELARAYQRGTAAYKLYEPQTLGELFEDLKEVLSAYADYVNAQLEAKGMSISAAQENTSVASGNIWLFQVNPNIYDIDSAIRVLPELESLVTNHADEIQSGDRAYLWKVGQDKGSLIACATISSETEVRKPTNSDLLFYRNADYANNPTCRVLLQIDKIYERPLTHDDFISVPALKELISRQDYGNNLQLSPSEHKAIEALLRGERPFSAAAQEPIRIEIPSPIRSGDYVEPPYEEIVRNVKKAGLRLEDRLIRRYHLALHSRGFVILAGMSGTGKTWLTKAYADAVAATYELVCVAPNWNSNEHLLGQVSPFKKNEYIDTSFSLFLRQASDAYLNAKEVGLTAKPFHVVLDEMNLAHVEYYFAVFLSKMEERARAGIATLRLGRDEVLLTPNLYFIGTVNVDETTHGFSDKVFDRAQLIELEATEELMAEHVAGKPYSEMLMEIWRIIHNVAPFGFRVLDDIMTYVDHAEAISASWEEAFDEQVTQKILTKTKGKDPVTEAALRKLEDYCKNKLPFTQNKLKAMLATRNRNGEITFFT